MRNPFKQYQTGTHGKLLDQIDQAIMDELSVDPDMWELSCAVYAGAEMADFII